MNTKRFFVAIFATVILSISFFACESKEDDSTPNPPTETDVVKEIYGYYGKSEAQVLPILDAKGWMKIVDSSELGVIYSYFSADSLNSYAVYSIDNIIKGVAYSVVKHPEYVFEKFATNNGKFYSLFENWEQSLSTISILNSVYQAEIYADEFEFYQDYEDRAIFLNDYQAKKSTLDMTSSSYTNSQMQGIIDFSIDYQMDNYQVYVMFQDDLLVEDMRKTTKNAWFRK